MHHRVNALVSACISGPVSCPTYSRVSNGVATVISAVIASSSAMASEMSLFSRSSASFSLSVRTICGTSTALKMPPETRAKTACGIIAPA